MAPPKRRRTSGPNTSKSSQSTLNFQQTKPGLSRNVKEEGDEQAKNSKQQEYGKSEFEAVLSPKAAHQSVDPPPSQQDEIKQEEPIAAPFSDEEEKSEEDEDEIAARKISQTRLSQYWAAKERERKAPRVHQQDLSLQEKILREFDVTNIYGPCIGITRIARWKRARDLGLKPPLEALAVLLSPETAGKSKKSNSKADDEERKDDIQESIMDRLIMSSRVCSGKDVVAEA